MKILRIIARLNVGGPARHVVWLTRELQDEEFRTFLVAGTIPKGEEDMGYFAEENGVSPIYLKEMSRELSAKDIISVFKLYRLMVKEAPDIVHTHTAKAGTVGRTAGFLYRWLTWRSLIGRPRRVRTVHTFHGHVFHSYYGKLKTRVFLAVERILAAVVTDRIVAISEQQRREINEDFGVGRPDQFQVIPLGIDLDAFAGASSDPHYLRSTIGATEGDLLVGFVGRLTEIKNIEHLLAVAALYNGIEIGSKPSLKFVIVGDGHLREHLEQKTKELGVGSIVEFLGNRSDTPNIYRALDIVALTSLNEGTPLSLIEAMASRRPVISTLVGGVVDLLGGILDDHDEFQVRERGIAVPNGPPDAFLNGLMALANNLMMREDLASAGQEFVEERYDKRRLVQDIKELYRRLI
jgi:glycosyltransferase involved in cell wall biosynthesis